MYVDFNNAEYLNEFLRTLDSKIRYIIDSQARNENLLECLSVQRETLSKLIENQTLIPSNIEVVIKMINFYHAHLEKYNGAFWFDMDMIKDIYNGYFEIDTMDKMVEVLKVFKERLDKIYENTDVYLKKQQYFKNKTLSVFNMLKLDDEGNLIVPIENKSSINLISSVMIDCNYKIGERNLILMDINHLNLKALQERNRLLEVRKNELLKREAKVALNSERKVVFESFAQKSLDLPIEYKEIIDKLVSIVEENSDYISLGYSDDVIAGYEILKDEKQKNYFIDPDTNVTLGIILRDIQEYLTYEIESINEETIGEFQNAINAYNQCMEMIKKESQVGDEYKKFLDDNEEMISMAAACARKFDRLKERLLPGDLNIIKSIDAYIDEVNKQVDDDSKEDEYEQISSFIENVTSVNQRLNQAVYYQYKKLEVVYNYYFEFNDTQDLEFKKMIFAEMNQALEEYMQYMASLKGDDKLEPKVENQNNVIYLMNEDGENLFLKYAEKDNIKYTSKNYEQMTDFVQSWILDRSECDIFLNSKKVKESVYDESIRRLRSSEYRLVYINLNNIDNMKIQLDKNCYVVIAVGKKSGDFDIYKFVNSTEVKLALKRLYEEIMTKIEEVDKLKISAEEKTKQKNRFIEEYVASNNEMFKKMLKSQIDRIKNNSVDGIQMGGQ